MSGGRTDEGVSFDMVGAVTSTREKEKNDSDLKIFETMLKAKKKKNKKNLKLQKQMMKQMLKLMIKIIQHLIMALIQQQK